MNFQKICVIGLGYIGLPTASTFAAHGINVLGVDISPRIVETINKGRGNQMPAFKDLLGEGKAHVLAAYVWSLSNGAGAKVAKAD